MKRGVEIVWAEGSRPSCLLKLRTRRARFVLILRDLPNHSKKSDSDWLRARVEDRHVTTARFTA